MLAKDVNKNFLLNAVKGFVELSSIGAGCRDEIHLNGLTIQMRSLRSCSFSLYNSVKMILAAEMELYVTQHLNREAKQTLAHGTQHDTWSMNNALVNIYTSKSFGNVSYPPQVIPLVSRLESREKLQTVGTGGQGSLSWRKNCTTVSNLSFNSQNRHSDKWEN